AEPEVPRLQRTALRRQGGAPPVHQHLPERRRHPFPLRAQDATEGQRRPFHRPGRRRRLTAAMARTTVRLTFRGDTRNDPIIYRLGQDYKVVTNIRRADVGDDTGWVELDLDGEAAEVDRALEYCRSRGIGAAKLERP